MLNIVVASWVSLIAITLAVNADNVEHSRNKSSILVPGNNDLIHDTQYTGVCAAYSAFGGRVPDTSFVDGKPFFSWDHVPVYWHGGSMTGLSDEAIGYVSHHPFATVTLEKFEGIYKFPRAGNAETKFIETATKIKAKNPKSQIMFFQNTVISFPNYELDCYLRKNVMLLRNDKGDPIPFKFHSFYPFGSCNGQDAYYTTNTLRIFDHSNPNFLPYWKQRLENFTNSNLFSGVFADRILYGLPGQNKAAKWRGKISDARIALWFKNFDSAIDAIGEVVYPKKKIVVGNNRSFNLSPTQKYGRMYEIFMVGANSFEQSPYTQLMSLIKEAKDRLIHIHGNSCFKDSHVRTLAGFLIGACKYSYYSCSNRFELTNDNKSLLCWKDDYNKKLGPPLGAAKISYKSTGVRFYRKFASGTKVFIWMKSQTSLEFASCICYSDGTASCYGGNCNQMERDFDNNYQQPLDKWDDDGCA